MMLIQKMYRYLGRNGTITTAIKLEDTPPISMVQLKAEKGKILTDGVRKAYSVIVFEDEQNNWFEVDDLGQK